MALNCLVMRESEPKRTVVLCSIFRREHASSPVLTRLLQYPWAIFCGVCLKHGAITMISSMVTVAKKHTGNPLLLLSSSNNHESAPFARQLSYSPRKPTWPTLPSMTITDSVHLFRVKKAGRIYSPRKPTWPTLPSMTRTHSAFRATTRNG